MKCSVFRVVMTIMARVERAAWRCPRLQCSGPGVPNLAGKGVGVCQGYRSR